MNQLPSVCLLFPVSHHHSIIWLPRAVIFKREAGAGVINLCERSNVEVIGIGVETNAVTRLFPTNIVIDDAAALQRTLFKLMERSLTAFAA